MTRSLNRLKSIEKEIFVIEWSKKTKERNRFNDGLYEQLSRREGKRLLIKWIENEEVDKIYFPINLQEMEVSSLEKIKFNFGLWEKELSVQFLDDLPENVIGL